MVGSAKPAKPNTGPKTKAKSQEEEDVELKTWKRLNTNMQSAIGRAVRKAKEGDDYKKASPGQKEQLEKDAKDKMTEK